MNKRYIKLIVAILSMNLLLQVTSFAQNQKTIVVKDESGNPLPAVTVTVGEAGKTLITNEKGEVSIVAEGRTPVLIEADGYASQIITVTPIGGLESIIMTKTPYQMGQKDEINLPFGTFKKRQIPGAVTAIDPREILLYDQQKSFTGALNGRVPGLFGSTNIRQSGNALIVVDGVPRPATDYNLQQIEQITVVKDLYTSLLYGSQASNGVIFITTKRGEPLKKSLHFTAESGMNTPISYPKFLRAADYMTLYNEALNNDGLPPKYTPEMIDSTASGLNTVRFPDEGYYNSTYLKNFSSFSNVIGELSGGNDVAEYYLNLGWSHTTGMIKLGEGGDERNDRLNMRGNVNYKLTDFIKLTFDGAATFNLGNAPRYTSSSNDFWTLSSTLLPNNTPVLIPASLMNDKALLGSAKLINNKYLLGGTSEYLTNIYGELTRNGPRVTNNRLLEISTGLDFDLGKITPGLKASAYFSFDLYSNFIADIMNSYAVYQPVYDDDSAYIKSWNKNNVDTKVNVQTLSDITFYRRSGIYGTVDYNRVFGDHEITVDALAYRDQYSTEGVFQPTKHLHFGVRANYMYQKKYVAELTGVMTGSVKLFETDPWGFSPGIGVGWIMSEESFLKDNSLINYLKLRANWAISNTDENLTSYYLGRDLYSSSTTYEYNQGTNNNQSRLLATGNSNVGFEKDMNFNLGFESALFDYRLAFEGSFFYYKNYDLLTMRTNFLPVYFMSLAFENYGSYQTQGFELGLNYTAKVSDLLLKVGSTLTYAVPKALIVDELNYNEGYRKQAGKPSDALFGWVANGLFKDQADIDASPYQSFGTVKPGDIKYMDLNSDGIVDDLDQKMIGNSQARVEYGFNIDLKFKGFELFALGTGQNGQKRYFNNSYYWVYGTRKYSEVVLNRWTPATASTASYPELTSLSGSNNFRNSTFWLYNYNWFSLQTAQLTYTLPVKIGGKAETRFFVRGSNLFMISKIKDKAQLNIGAPPQSRSLSLGLTVVL